MVAVDLVFPFEGRWLTRNSRGPGARPRTALFATSAAIDFVPVDDAGRTAPITFGSLVRPEPAHGSPGSGAPSSRPPAAWSSRCTTPHPTMRPSRAAVARLCPHPAPPRESGLVESPGTTS